MKNLAWAIALRFAAIFATIIVFAYIAFGQNDYRGVIHLHFELSHDSDGKLADILKAAEDNNVDFIVLTDHWSPELYKKPYSGFWGDILLITGAEISKNDGVTLIALPLPKDFAPENDWRKNVVSLHKKGSLALASHIEFSKTAQLVGVDGIEITNLHSILVDRSYFGFLWTWFKALYPPNWDLAYIFNDEILKNLPRWHYLNQEIHLPAFAGNDTHDNYRLFYKLGPKLGSYNNTLKLITTHIWADELSEKSVIEAIKNGQSYFAFEIFGNTKGFKFYAVENYDGKKIISVQAPPHKDTKNTTLKILHDGRVVKKGTGILLNLKNPSPGNYYTEIWKNGKPWIFSNPIQITSK